MSLRKFDLNLLTVFDAIYTEGNLTRAAAQIGMSQPAMSNALSRLRHIARDDLFVREGRGIHPTAGAHKLAPTVRQALGMLEGALSRTSGFDPGQGGPFHIGGVEYYEVALLPRLMSRLQGRTDNLILEGTAGLSSELAKPLRYGDIDIVIDYVPLTGPEYRSELLFSEQVVVLHRRGHPSIKGRITIEEFVASKHVFRSVRPDEPKPEVDTVLAQAGLQRDICVTLNNWLALPATVARSDMICCAPRLIAETYAEPLGLVVSPLPLEIRPVPIYMIWHESQALHPAHRWLRAQMKWICRPIRVNLGQA
jgi:DNA-binding transcriptional LysR family regulator